MLACSCGHSIQTKAICRPDALPVWAPHPARQQAAHPPGCPRWISLRAVTPGRDIRVPCCSRDVIMQPMCCCGCENLTHQAACGVAVREAQHVAHEGLDAARVQRGGVVGRGREEGGGAALKVVVQVHLWGAWVRGCVRNEGWVRGRAKKRRRVKQGLMEIRKRASRRSDVSRHTPGV